MKSLNDVIWEDIDLKDGKKINNGDVSIHSSCGSPDDPTVGPSPFFFGKKCWAS